jgi:hypothetical protein
MEQSKANGSTSRTARVHVTQGLATSVSTDGSTALMRFRADNGEDVEVTFPAQAIKVMATMVQDLIVAAAQRNVGMANVPLRRPRASFVGHSDQDRGTVYLMFDKDTASEVAIALRDDDALPFADAIRDNVLSRMTPQQRAKRLGEPVVRSSSSSPSTKLISTKLIIPM